MSIILIIGCIFFLIVSPLFRLIITNLHNIGIYSAMDLYEYIKYHKWDTFNFYGIDMFVGMFGHGKTLSMTHRARLIYERYGARVRFISNYKLVDIPYIPLVNFNQLVELGEDEHSDDYVGTVVLIDEIESVLSHRNFANFPLDLLYTLTQQRKRHIYILCSAQRFFMVDKIFRSITTNVYDCSKYWRFQHCVCFDAWDYENAMNAQLVARKSNSWWFVKNSDFASYDTTQMITKSSAEDFLSNEESLVRKGLDSIQNDGAIIHRSKKSKKQIKRQNRRR